MIILKQESYNKKEERWKQIDPEGDEG